MKKFLVITFSLFCVSLAGHAQTATPTFSELFRNQQKHPVETIIMDRALVRIVWDSLDDDTLPMLQIEYAQDVLARYFEHLALELEGVNVRLKNTLALQEKVIAKLTLDRDELIKEQKEADERLEKLNSKLIPVRTTPFN